MTRSLVGRRVVVVGGSGGIGLAVARAALAAGAEVTIASRSAERLRSAVAALDGKAAARPVDARDPAALGRFFADLPAPDHVVATTSEAASRHGVNGPLAPMDLTAAAAFFEGKFWNQVRVARAALARLAPDGSVTLTSGIASRRTLPGHTIIGAVNAALEGFVRQLAREAGPQRVNAVAPGLTRTGAYDTLSEEARVALFARGSALPLGRVGLPEEVADAYLYAMTSPWLTGTVLDMDGGHLVA